MKILLVEDDANLREVTQRSLEKERYVVDYVAGWQWPGFVGKVERNA